MPEDIYVVEMDEEAALTFCAGNREFFLEIIQEFAQENDIEKIDSLYKEKDWKQYQITTHALKGTALTFGLNQFSEEAKEIEQAAKRMDFDYIDAHHDVLLKHYQMVVDYINETYKNA